MENITIEIAPQSHRCAPPHQWDKDCECVLCGRPMNFHKGYAVVVVSAPWARYDAATDSHVTTGGPVVLAPIESIDLTDPASEWGCCVGPRCAKLIPKGYKVTMRKANSMQIDK